uniref:Uncharacterized protein n=1 Tax=Romanomermis culicivorax TaxID=13658 RepID=A0A915ITK4_ROMCU
MVSVSKEHSWSGRALATSMVFWFKKAQIRPEGRISDRAELSDLNSGPNYMKPGTTSSALVILSVLSSVAILLLIIISIVWIYRRYKKSSGRCRPSSEASTSSGGSDPILRSIYGYHFHRPYNLYDDKKVDRPDGAFLAKHPAHERRGTPRINIQQCRSLLTLSPCDSDGCSTALTSDVSSDISGLE